MNTPTELIRLAKKGDAHAFAQLYESVYLDLYRFAVYTLHHKQDAEDAVSETILDAFHQIHSLRDINAFKPWIFRILTAKCSRHIRRYANAPSALEEGQTDQIADPQRDANDLCEQTDLRRAFASLPDEDRLILSMNIFAGYSSKEIGKQLGMNANTVRSRQSRALKKLESMLS